MSGHSKWATIHRQKEITDQKRGQSFTKVANAITIAVRESGGVTDPQLNFKLRLAMEKGKEINMPRDNIERARRRAQGKPGESGLEEITYEGFGPGGVAIMASCLTDNHQRTAQEIKNIFNRGGGTLAGPGSVSYQFEQAGFLAIKKPENAEEALLKIMDFPGVTDVEETSDAVEKIEEVKGELISAGFALAATELIMKPKVTVAINDKGEARKIIELVEKIDSQDDVQKVYTNFDIPDELLQTLNV